MPAILAMEKETLSKLEGSPHAEPLPQSVRIDVSRPPQNSKMPAAPARFCGVHGMEMGHRGDINSTSLPPSPPLRCAPVPCLIDLPSRRAPGAVPACAAAITIKLGAGLAEPLQPSSLLNRNRNGYM